MAVSVCSKKSLLILFFLSAIPLSILIALELSTPSTHVFHYHSTGFFRECARWDHLNHRFLVSLMEGGLSQVVVPHDYSSGTVLTEVPLVKDVDLHGNSSLGISIDYPRNRVLVAVADVMGNKYSALAAYDLSTWQRLFLTQLSSPNDAEKSFADDVAVDAEGNAYVTDATSSKIWKVDENGKLLSIIKSPLFTMKEWYKNLVALNGIVYHPDGFLIVIHTFSGNLYKIDIATNEVKLIEVKGGSLTFGDGLALLSPAKIVVATNPSAILVESSDGWKTASVGAKFRGPTHRLATSATVKDGKVYLIYMVGIGYPKKKHAIVEAVFSK